MSVETQKETLGFQTEVKQLLHLMIHSLYSNKEIFLRELISNASDAADKLRFEALAKPELLEGGAELKIRLSFDKDAKTVTLEDNGIGMSREEVVAHLGTIAKSGTADFMKNLTGDQKKDSHLIGQFGVGFYSAFIVADQVDVYTRRAGAAASEGVHWSSKGEGEFEVATVDKAERGTRIVLHLKSGEEEFADGWRLRNVVKKYSDHIALPIQLPKEEPAAEGEEQHAEDQEQQHHDADYRRERGRIGGDYALFAALRDEIGSLHRDVVHAGNRQTHDAAADQRGDIRQMAQAKKPGELFDAQRRDGQPCGRQNRDHEQ